MKPVIAKKLKKYGLTGLNKPKRTPSHPTKSHVVLAKENGKVQLVRFGQQGVRGAGKNPKTPAEKARLKRFDARFKIKENPPSKLSPRYWSKAVKW